MSATLTLPTESAAVKALDWQDGADVGCARFAFVTQPGGGLFKIVDLGFGSQHPLVLLQRSSVIGTTLGTTARATSVDTLINDYSLAAV